MSYIAIMVVTPLETNLARDIQTADIARPSPSLLQATPQPSLSEAVFTPLRSLAMRALHVSCRRFSGREYQCCDYLSDLKPTD